MYVTLRDRPAVATGPVPTPRRRLRAVGTTVVLLGLTSLLTDLSGEMVNAVLPLYLVLQLGYSPFQFGLINGLYQGVTAVVRLAGGIASDRWRRHKEVAAAGYGLSALAKAALLAAGGASGLVTLSLVIDRVGKGIRTAPRDAMLAMGTRTRDLGLTFGVHRAMDTFGALLGPFAAFAILAVEPDGYDLVFVVSTAIAVVGVAVIVLLVDRRHGGDNPIPDPRTPPDDRPAGPPRSSVRSAVGLLRDRRLRRLTVAGIVLSLATIGDAFVYLRLQSGLNLSQASFPLLPAGMNAAYLVLAVPLGRVADRVGRVRVFLAGNVALAATYLVLLLPHPGAPVLVASLALLGAYYAATDGVLSAVASAMLASGTRTTGLAVVQTGVALGQFAASTLFGLIWSAWGVAAALRLATVALAAGVVVSVLLLRSRGGVTPPADDAETFA